MHPFVCECAQVWKSACLYERGLQGSAVTGHSSLTGPLLQAAQCSEAWPSLHEALFASLDLPLSRATWLPPFLPSRKEWEGQTLSLYSFLTVFPAHGLKVGHQPQLHCGWFELLTPYESRSLVRSPFCFIPSFCPTSLKSPLRDSV